MSVQLSDVLLILSDPKEQQKFRDDPNGFLERFELTHEEVAAVIEADIKGFLRLTHGRVKTASDNKRSQFPRSSSFSELSIAPIESNVDVHVDVTVQLTEDISAAFPGNVRFIDENNVIYHAVVRPRVKAA